MTLRKCTDCGLEAHSEVELDYFKKDSRAKHGRQNRCKACYNKRQKQWRLLPRNYLRHKFNDMKQRCYNPNSSNYYLYGERGVTICQEWLDDPEAFVEWALTNGWIRELEIDRIDNDGRYSPDNCRWVTPQTQARNTRRKVTDFEKGTRICRKCGVKKSLEEFYRSRDKAAGRRYLCKQCQNIDAASRKQKVKKNE